MPGPTYPPPPTSGQVDDYHGTLVADPYRPLEDGDAPESRAWIAAENELTERILDGFPPRRAIRARLGALWAFPRAGAPWRRGDRWFQLRNSGLQDQDVLWTADGPEAHGAELLDPNGLGEQGTTALTAIAVSESGELVACAMSDAGSDWRTWGVRRVLTGEDLPDRIPWAKFAPAAWTHDDAGFFYGRYPEPPADAAYDAPNHDMELCYHRLGTDAAEDRRRLRDARPAGVDLRRVRGLRRRRPPRGDHRPRDGPQRTGSTWPTWQPASTRPSCDRSSTRPMPITSTSRRSGERSTC